MPRNLDRRTTITIGDQTTTVEANDLQKICDLGRGAYGIVEKMRHKPSGTIMAVKVSEFFEYTFSVARETSSLKKCTHSSLMI